MAHHRYAEIRNKILNLRYTRYFSDNIHNFATAPIAIFIQMLEIVISVTGKCGRSRNNVSRMFTEMYPLHK